MGTLVRRPVALTVTVVRYLLGSPSVHRTEEEGDARDLPPPLPAGVSPHGVQDHADGWGPLLHRRYSVRIIGARLGPEELMARMMADPDLWSPEFAVFRRTRGAGDRIRTGDEFLIRMPGPWNGPVKVVSADATGFRFATLDGHLEAGLIDFRATAAGEGTLDFVVESWARPGDVWSHVLYDHLPVAKEVQLVMWTHACRRASELAGGRMRDGIAVHTRRVPTSGRTCDGGQ